MCIAGQHFASTCKPHCKTGCCFVTHGDKEQDAGSPSLVEEAQSQRGSGKYRAGRTGAAERVLGARHL